MLWAPYLNTCRNNSNTKISKVLTSWLGRGYDALQEDPKIMAMKLTFAKCITSVNGSELIPDGAGVIPLDRGDIKITKEVINTHNDLIASKRLGIEMGVDVPVSKFMGLSGSLNGNLLGMKAEMTEKNTQISVKFMVCLLRSEGAYVRQVGLYAKKGFPICYIKVHLSYVCTRSLFCIKAQLCAFLESRNAKIIGRIR
ncbi:hypothetical protein WR25_07306 [Diploscapter pachys]|uniref:Uncharacterized protein n=1 Tax=Diploscapter pachys TaxID=2018661 RepID=A0A2A2LII4_9BILA|nr:hypothetical protein WR25_07306 [Diploscapter pachys]